MPSTDTVTPNYCIQLQQNGGRAYLWGREHTNDPFVQVRSELL